MLRFCETEKPLTAKDRIWMAALHLTHGLDQQLIAFMFGTNAGRVNEACKAIELAASNPKKTRGYKETPRTLKRGGVPVIREKLVRRKRRKVMK